MTTAISAPTEFCSQCLKTQDDETVEKISRCSRCRFTQYCGETCQKADWKKQHKFICGELKRQSEFWKQRPQPIEYWRTYSLAMVFSGLLRSPFNQPLTENKVAIDLGCGNGWSTNWLLSRGWKVIALDYYQEKLDSTEELAREENTAERVAANLEKVKGDVFEYAFPDNIDLVIAQDLFPYLDPLKLGDLLRKIHGALNDRGYLFGSFFGPNHLCITLHGAWSVKNVPFAKNLISNGFEVERCKYRKKENRISNTIDFTARKKPLS